MQCFANDYICGGGVMVVMVVAAVVAVLAVLPSLTAHGHPVVGLEPGMPGGTESKNE